MTSYKTPAAQTFTEALSNYLSGSEWQQNIQMFVKSNCDAFLGSDEFNHEHHALWRTYQDICESILEMALSQAGGSIESLEKALDEVASIPSKGPREDIAKDILDKLLTFDDFDAFAKMMEDAARDEDYGESDLRVAHDVVAVEQRVEDTQEEAAGISDEIIKNLLTLGFEQELIDVVVASSPPNTTLEQLVMTLSEMHAGDNSPAASRYKSKKPNLAINSNSSPDAKPSLDRHDTPVVLKNESKHLAEFAKEGNLGDVNELHAKFIMARSLLDTFIDGDISPGVVLLVQWASDMTELHAEIEMHHARKQSMTAPTVKRPDEGQGGLVGWFKELEETRNVADNSSLVGNMLSDTEVARMAELDKIAQTGTDDEQLLHGMISRHDEVVKTINNLHKRCGAMCGPGTGVSRQTLEELYLYLKEKVNAGSGGAAGEGLESAAERDLSSVADELHERVYTMVDSAHGGEIINILLEMHVMEDEQKLLRHKIDSVLGSPMHGAQEKHGQRSPRFFESDESDRKGEEYRTTADAKTSREEAEAAENAARVEELKSKHKDALKSLRESLDAQKAKKLGSLEARLMRRKAIGEKEKAALRNKEGGATLEEERDLLERLAAAEAEITTEIEQNSEHFDKLKDGIISGFKKACIYEMKLTKTKGADLTREENEQAHRDAADALKKRYLRDRKALAESLEVERVRRRARILQQLAQRKKKAGQDMEAVKKAEEQAAGELVDFEQDYTGQERSALEEPQEGMLLALAGIFSDTSQLTQKDEGDADDDDFFGEDEEGGHGKGRGSSAAMWLDGILKSRDAFMTANSTLNDTLKSPALDEKAMIEAVRDMRVGEDGEILSHLLESPDGSGESGPVTEHMVKVLTNAFANHVVTTREKGLDTTFDYSAARDSILEEFSNSKASYEEALQLAQQRGKDALARRRSQRGEAVQNGSAEANSDIKGNGSDEQESLRFTRSVNDYENAVDAFLEDSLMFGGPAERKQNPSFASITKGFDAYKYQGGKTAKIHRGPRGERDSKESDGGTLVSPRAATLAARSAAEEKEVVQNKEEAKGIKERHQTREKELIDALELEMQRKKQTLKMRINKRKQRKQEQESDAFGIEAEVEDSQEEMKEAEELLNIEAAFDKAVGLLKKTEESRLHGVNVGQLIDVMNRFANKESAKKAGLNRVSSNTGNTGVADVGRLAILPPITAKAEAKDSYGEVDAFMDELSLDDGGGSKGGMQKVMEERRNMAVEVNRISETFNEENQKLDLMMKIQQARQKQSLQRKLLQRRGTAVGAGGNLRAGAGFGPGTNTPGVPTLQMPARGLENSGYGNVSREEALSGIVTSPSPRK